MKTHSILRNLFKKMCSSFLTLLVSLLSFSPLSFSSRQRSALSCKEIVSSRNQDYQRQEEKIKTLDKQIKQILKRPGSIVTVSQFPSSFFNDTKTRAFLNLQEAESQFGFLNEIFGKAFIPIAIFVKDQWFIFGYKLVHSLEPQWEDYFIFNTNVPIWLDPVFQKIRIEKREFSLPYLNFKVLRTILNAFQRAPYLKEKEKLSEMELALQVLFWCLVDEEKISSLHPYYPLEISEAFSALRYLFPKWYKAFMDDIGSDFPKLEKHLNQIRSNQMDSRSILSQSIGLKKRIAILHLYRGGESSLEISRRLKIRRETVLKIERDFTRFLKGWKKWKRHTL